MMSVTMYQVELRVAPGAEVKETSPIAQFKHSKLFQTVKQAEEVKSQWEESLVSEGRHYSLIISPVTMSRRTAEENGFKEVERTLSSVVRAIGALPGFGRPKYTGSGPSAAVDNPEG